MSDMESSASAAAARSNKLKKAISVKRKRGAEPTAKGAATEDQKSQTSARASSSKYSLRSLWRSNAPSYLQKRPTKGMLMDVAVFTAGIVIIYKFGSTMNSFIQEQVPSEASLR